MPLLAAMPVCVEVNVMKSSLKPGLTATRAIRVDRNRTIDFLGEELRVYATPEFVRDIEWVCREFLLEYVDEGEDSVGIGIELTHGAATPLDMEVEISVTVNQVDGRQVWFDVVARDAAEEIGSGRHGRFIVAVDKLRQRIAGKIEAAKQG